jgi:hypothetical protein
MPTCWRIQAQNPLFAILQSLANKTCQNTPAKMPIFSRSVGKKSRFRLVAHLVAYGIKQNDRLTEGPTQLVGRALEFSIRTRLARGMRIDIEGSSSASRDLGGINPTSPPIPPRYSEGTRAVRALCAGNCCRSMNIAAKIRCRLIAPAVSAIRKRRPIANARASPAHLHLAILQDDHPGLIFWRLCN